MNKFRKSIAFFLIFSLMAAVFSGCSLGPKNEETTQITSAETTEITAPESTETPTAAPTEAPTAAPTEAPTEAPTAAPTEAPTAAPTETPTAAPTEQPAETSAETQAPTVQEAYYVRVNCTTNTVNIFAMDQNGEYSIPYKVMACSSGLDETPTPEGTYRLTGNRWKWLELQGGVWGMYTTQIIGNYLFHSVPYTEYGNHGSLQEGEFDKLGEDASHGCIRLQVADAKWIYDHMWVINGVEIYNDTDPGPMGKPIPPRIGAREFPGWDPSDRVEENPWYQGE